MAKKRPQKKGGIKGPNLKPFANLSQPVDGKNKEPAFRTYYDPLINRKMKEIKQNNRH